MARTAKRSTPIFFTSMYMRTDSFGFLNACAVIVYLSALDDDMLLYSAAGRRPPCFDAASWSMSTFSRPYIGCISSKVNMKRIRHINKSLMRKKVNVYTVSLTIYLDKHQQ